MTTTEQIVEAVALRLADDGGEPRVGRYERTIARACVEVALPLIRKQLADEVRAEKGAGNEFRDTVLERAARLIEGVSE